LTYFDALKYVKQEQTGDGPNHLKDASRDTTGLGHGVGYKYPHAYREGYVPEQYLPEEMQGLYFYAPRDMGYEKRIAERLALLRQRDAEESLEKRVRRYADDDSAT